MDLNDYCFLFPGQGAQDPKIFNDLKINSKFSSFYDVICDHLKLDFADQAIRDPSILNRNKYSSLASILSSAVYYESLRTSGYQSPIAVCGYSVGQLFALFAAGAFNFSLLIEIVIKRSELMDECLAGRETGMCAVIGVKEEDLRSLLFEAGDYGFISISNYNCMGQYTLAGDISALSYFERQVDKLKPKKILRVPVSGAWHCSLLKPAGVSFLSYLQNVKFNPLTIKVADNVTGKLLPSSPDGIKELLSKHVYSPVLWRRCVETMIEFGGKNLIECGYGTTLTKFGFFIDRRVKHLHGEKLCAG